MIINIESQCNCPCENDVQFNSANCNGNGDLSCGICQCHEGFSGLKCECDEKNSQTEDDPL